MLPVVKHKNILKIAMLSQKSIVNTYLSLTLSLIVLNKKLTIEALEVITPQFKAIILLVPPKKVKKITIYRQEDIIYWLTAFNHKTI